MRSEHVLFKDIPFKNLSADRGNVAFAITLPTHFSDGEEIHGGLFTILLDTILAVAAWTKMDVFQPQATINLKTDFFASVPPGTTIECHATCEDIVDEVAFCRGRALCPDGKKLAHAAGTFMVGTSSSTPKGSRL
ncbi:MAG: PaaI family thioesterase [Pseudomonadota bacterium]